jgi:malate dehydrogenase
LLTRRSFAEKVIKAVNGEKGIVEPSFVYLPGVSGGDAIAKATGCDFFSVPIELGVSSSTLLFRQGTNYT